MSDPLSITHPYLAFDAEGWDPSTITAGSGRKVKWRCKLGHVYQSAIYSRTAGSGCPICAGKIVLSGFNDLQSQFPDIAAEADGWDPSEVLFGTHKKMRWRCPNNHIYESRVVGRTLGKGCSVCAGNTALIGFNDLKSHFPDIAAEAEGWDPETITTRSGLKRNWRCSKGHLYEMRVADRTEKKRGQKCPYCSGKRVLAGFNDLKTTFPDIAAEADGWDPSTLTYASNKKCEWKCSLGHRWATNVNSRTNPNLMSGCPVCAGTQILTGFNDLKTLFPRIAIEADGWDPTTVSAHTAKKFRWRCEYGHTWIADVDHRTSVNSRGCPSCAKTGYDPNRDGYLYFLRHNSLGLLQIGITNVPDSRLQKHRAFGWLVVEVRGPMDGFLTQAWERDILEMLQAKGANIDDVVRIAGSTMTGRTESWVEDSFPVKSLADLMNFVHAEES